MSGELSLMLTLVLCLLHSPLPPPPHAPICTPPLTLLLVLIEWKERHGGKNAEEKETGEQEGRERVMGGRGKKERWKGTKGKEVKKSRRSKKERKQEGKQKRRREYRNKGRKGESVGRKRRAGEEGRQAESWLPNVCCGCRRARATTSSRRQIRSASPSW